MIVAQIEGVWRSNVEGTLETKIFRFVESDRIQFLTFGLCSRKHFTELMFKILDILHAVPCASSWWRFNVPGNEPVRIFSMAQRLRIILTPGYPKISGARGCEHFEILSRLQRVMCVA